jgi:hypothetical protein
MRKVREYLLVGFHIVLTAVTLAALILLWRAGK